MLLFLVELANPPFIAIAMREVCLLRGVLLVSLIVVAMRVPLEFVRARGMHAADDSTARTEKRLAALERPSLELANVKTQLAAVISRALSWESACGLSTEWFERCGREVQLWGERNSGTNALQYLVQQNFGIREIDFSRFGHKHMFMKHNSEARGTRPSPGIAQAAQSLVPAVVMVREPLEWLLAMHSRPHHANHLENTTLDQFVHSEWNVARGKGGGGHDEYSRDILELRSVKVKYLKRQVFSHFI